MSQTEATNTPAVCACEMMGLAAAAAARSSSWIERLSTDGGGFVVATCEPACCAGLAAAVRMLFPRTTSLSPTYTHGTAFRARHLRRLINRSP